MRYVTDAHPGITRQRSGTGFRYRLEGRRLAKIVVRCRDLPGYELFQYLDNEGNRHSIDASDVKDYLREITEQDFTARDFRSSTTRLRSAASATCFPR